MSLKLESKMSEKYREIRSKVWKNCKGSVLVRCVLNESVSDCRLIVKHEVSIYVKVLSE